ncbi:unnamed protein product [Rodentolepis nana]|uniref:uridine/cytidine kinase n=1 Tax=Rodentolepis nana TaxID=102285 RepID=A0A0R3TYD2_RODNA|nr:unnamed protein product [Rodentolepis nana]
MAEYEKLTSAFQKLSENLFDSKQACFIIGISGGSGCGKTTLAKNIVKQLGQKSIIILSMDSYYKELSDEDKALAHEGRFNFDHPSAIDSQLLFKHFSMLKEGKTIEVPIYDFVTHSRTGKTVKVDGVRVIIFEGIMTYCYQELLELMDVKIFVETDAEVRLSRRLLRDIRERGRQELSDEDKALAHEGRFNFDHPSAIDSQLLFKHFSMLKEGKTIEVPIYDFVTHSRTGKTVKVDGVRVIIFEGIMTYCYQELLELMDVKIFVETDAEVRLSRRLLRDIRERGRQVNDIIRQYFSFVKPAYDNFIAPTKSRADIIVPFEDANPVAIDLLVCGIGRLLIEHLKRRCSSVRSTNATLYEEEPPLARA